MDNKWTETWMDGTSELDSAELVWSLFLLPLGQSVPCGYAYIHTVLRVENSGVPWPACLSVCMHIYTDTGWTGFVFSSSSCIWHQS